MVKALFDTNILIDYLRGIPASRQELARYDNKAISIITWMEVLIGAPDALRDTTRAFLNGFAIVPIDAAVAECTIVLRQKHRMKLPDAIVWASAQAHGRLLVTRDRKGFPRHDPAIRFPYVLAG